MSEVGHNLPPDMTITVGEVAKDLSDWMAEHPVIATEEEAREAKVLIDRANLGIKDLEDERIRQVRPLNEHVKQINDYYRGSRELLARILEIIRPRLGGYLAKEETRRIAIAEEAARVAEEAEKTARTAERDELEAIEAASHGELGLNIGAATENADKAFQAYTKAERQAAVAERETKVRVGGGFTRAISLRTRESIIVNDPIAAIQDIGLRNEIILDAIVTASRAYKKINGKYPDGVGVITRREV